jgi:GntR family transcriptional regulator, rspAB operon transcriptional repressor
MSMAERANSKADQVYSTIKESILSGALEPGAPIDKAKLCERLNVSRFPVSAAISRLAFEHLVLIEPQHGSFVSRISVRDVRERLLIRRALEGEISAEAARRFDAAGRETLSRNVNEAIAAAAKGDRSRFYALDLEFHTILTSRLGLLRSAEILDAQRVHLERVRRLLLSPPGRIDATIAEHKIVLEGVLSGDADRARRAMEHHMQEFGAIVENFSRTRPDLFSA